MNIQQATRAYESWLGQNCSIVQADLRLKHKRMAESPFVFLRATFYRWVQIWTDLCADLAKAPRVLAVGDLHVENFGTWRDREGRLVWGVNDVDEAYPLPYTQDLVRLATSAVLASAASHFALTKREICDAILDGYRMCLERRGRAFVLAERHRWLRQIALGELRDPVVFWPKIEACPPVRGRVPDEVLRGAMPNRKLPFQVLRRVAGVGSLGRPRYVALANWGGSMIAREAKAALPSAVSWAFGVPSSKIHCESLVSRAVRVPDPFFSANAQWIVRRLAPDCARIELTELPLKRDEAKLLRAMGGETANMHLGTAGVRLLADLDRQPERWLQDAATTMAKVVAREWRQWQKLLRGA